MSTDSPPKTMSQLRRGTVGYCVMALLSRRERYAVELVRELAAHQALAAGQGTIYPLLSRLRSDGMVATVWKESPSGPPRRYYSLTDKGRAALERFRGEWKQFSAAVDTFMED
ncbi:PadR family transcriptional regulator [Marinactinospora rubrisoli]|uniref:PadR family transcriptional regulator n=1 Tax=Marinactinospora rubrisoli TaxID=2715399 RepID=A0ABW2KPH3_9ACTN